MLEPEDDLFRIIESLGPDDDLTSTIELPESDHDLPETTEPLIPSTMIDQLSNLLSSSSSNCNPDISCFFPSTPFVYYFKKIEHSEFYNDHYLKTIDFLLNELHLAVTEEINDNFYIDFSAYKIVGDDLQFKPELQKFVAMLLNDEKYKNKNAKPVNINLAEVITAAFSYPVQYRDELAVAFVSEYRNFCTQHDTITPFRLRCDLIEKISSIRETLNKITTKFLDAPNLELDDIKDLPPLLINMSKGLHDIQSYCLFNKAITPFISNLEDAQKSLLINAKSEIQTICIRLLEDLPEQLSLKKGKDDALIKEYLTILCKENQPKKELIK